jgi:hypothetical protein
MNMNWLDGQFIRGALAALTTARLARKYALAERRPAH